MEINHYPELAAETRRVLAEKGWSQRQAMRNTGLHNTLVQYMAQGQRPKPENLTKWAVAIGEDPAQWLRWAGYDFIGQLAGASAAPPGAPETNGSAQAALPSHVAEERALYEAGGLQARFDGGSEGILLLKDAEQLSPEDREEIYRALRTMIRGKQAERRGE